MVQGWANVLSLPVLHQATWQPVATLHTGTRTPTPSYVQRNPASCPAPALPLHPRPAAAALLDGNGLLSSSSQGHGYLTAPHRRRNHVQVRSELKYARTCVRTALPSCLPCRRGAEYDVACLPASFPACPPPCMQPYPVAVQAAGGAEGTALHDAAWLGLK